MLDRLNLTEISRGRLEDAEALFQCQRYDGAVYVCGYAVEIALKAKICETLNWAGYPSTKGEFNSLQTFRTHDLDILLYLSGIGEKLKAEKLADWSNVAEWDPEARYNPIGNVTAQAAERMIQSVRSLLEALL